MAVCVTFVPLPRKITSLALVIAKRVKTINHKKPYCIKPLFFLGEKNANILAQFVSFLLLTYYD